MNDIVSLRPNDITAPNMKKKKETVLKNDSDRVEISSNSHNVPVHEAMAVDIKELKSLILQVRSDMKKLEKKYIDADNGKDTAKNVVTGKIGRIAQKKELQNIAPGHDLSLAATGTTAGVTMMGAMRELLQGDPSILKSVEHALGGQGLGLSKQTTGYINTFAREGFAWIGTYLSGLAAGLNLLKGSKEIAAGIDSNSKHMAVNGILDVGLAVTTTMSFIPQFAGIAFVGTTTLMSARLISGAFELNESINNPNK